MAAKSGRNTGVSPAVIVLAVVVLAGIGLFAWLSLAPAPTPAQAPSLTAEARAYLPFLQLSEIEPRTSESYIQGSLFEIIGKLTNNGVKTVRKVQVTCVFHNTSAREIKRELVSIADPRGVPLAPRATRSFRLAFDDIPNDWDHQMPSFVIARITFQ